MSDEPVELTNANLHFGGGPLDSPLPPSLYGYPIEDKERWHVEPNEVRKTRV